MIPLVETNPPDGYTVYIDFADLYARGLMTDRNIETAIKSAARVTDQLRVIHLTTHRPYGIRPGDHATVRVVPAIPYIAQHVGGYTFRAADRSPDHYTTPLAVVVNAEPVLLGVRIAHELGHIVLPTWAIPGTTLRQQHNTIPGNFMNEQSLTATSTDVTREQTEDVMGNLFRVNEGHRLITVPYTDRVAPG